MNANASAAAPAEPSIEDRWIVSRLNAASETANRAIEQYRYHELAQELWKFFWHEFCDWYLELKKVSATGWGNAVAAFETALRLLHPAMPFLTEELWQRLDLPEGHAQSIALAPYPQYRAELADPVAEKEIGLLQDIVFHARRLRTEKAVEPKRRVKGTLQMASTDLLGIAQRHAAVLSKLVNADLVIELRDEGAPLVDAVKNPDIEAIVSDSPAEKEAVTKDFTLNLEFGAVTVGAVQLDAQRKRLEKEREQLEKNIASLERQLSDEAFLAKAPPKVVEGMCAKLAEYKAKRDKMS
jgi:valyl-tRNA synthetase